MIQSKHKCPLCGSPIVAYQCGNPIFKTTYAVMCSNEGCEPMPSEHGPVKAVLQRPADDLFAQGLSEDEAIDRLALDYAQHVQEMYGKSVTKVGEKVMGMLALGNLHVKVNGEDAVIHVRSGRNWRSVLDSPYSVVLDCPEKDLSITMSIEQADQLCELVYTIGIGMIRK